VGLDLLGALLRNKTGGKWYCQKSGITRHNIEKDTDLNYIYVHAMQTLAVKKA
jgi:hypothetical protein